MCVSAACWNCENITNTPGCFDLDARELAVLFNHQVVALIVSERLQHCFSSLQQHG